MEPFLAERFGNPSGHYEAGRLAQDALDDARATVAACLNARTAEVLFTSGGTEAINTATLGIAYAMRRAGAGAHVITTAIEHHAGLHAVQFLEELGFEVTTIGCDGFGHVSTEEFERALRPDTVLASVMLANNEVGTIEPVAELAGILREYAVRQRHRVMLHTDAVQAPGWTNVDVQALGIDALSLSSHKFGGPKGSGVLFLRRATPFHALLLGGGQEMQKRAGTENVAGIVGTAKALELASAEVAARAARVRALRERLREGVLEAVPDAETNGCQENCLPNNLNMSFDGIEGDDLVSRLDARGIAASTGSACSNAMWEPSHVLLAMGVPLELAIGSVRLTLSPELSEADIDYVAAHLPALVAGLREAGAPALP